jgi:hypothetical protein
MGLLRRSGHNVSGCLRRGDVGGICRQRPTRLERGGVCPDSRCPHKPEEPLGQRACAQTQITLWQRRFWEYQTRNQKDFNPHLDYIHWDPVKHGHVARVADWPYSTFHWYVAKGIYALLLTAFYPPLAEIANPGNAAVGIDVLYPAEHSAFLERCD